MDDPFFGIESSQSSPNRPGCSVNVSWHSGELGSKKLIDVTASVPSVRSGASGEDENDQNGRETGTYEPAVNHRVWLTSQGFSCDPVREAGRRAGYVCRRRDERGCQLRPLVGSHGHLHSSRVNSRQTTTSQVVGSIRYSSPREPSFERLTVALSNRNRTSGTSFQPGWRCGLKPRTREGGS